MGGVYTSRGPVCRVGATWDVNCVERDVRVNNADEGVDPLKDFVDGMVTTSTVLPTLNHSLVVSVDGKVPSSMARVIEMAYQTFKANSFCPSDISSSLQGLPSWDEPPGSPPAQDDDGHLKARACIRECANIEQLDGGRNGSAKSGLLQEGEPPVQV